MSILKLLTCSVVLLFLGLAKGDLSNYTGYMIVGGKSSSKVAYFYDTYNNNDPLGDCDSFADAPFVTQHAIGLRDACGRPMVCGGSQNPDQKSCYVYKISNNTWSQGPSLKRRRVGASTACLDDGVCWVFGGKSKSYTEFYNPATGQFEMGPAMPVNSAHGLCSVVAESGLIYLAARREPGITRAFVFNPTTRIFTELPSLDVEKRYMACGVTFTGEDQFYVIGGGVSEAEPTSSNHIYKSASGVWSAGPDYLFPIYAAATMNDYANQWFFFSILGGVTSSGDETDARGVIHVEAWDTFVPGPFYDVEGGPWSYAVTIPVRNVCPGAPGL